MKISFGAKPLKDNDLFLLAISPKEIKKIDGPYKAILKALVAANPEFKAKAGEVITTVMGTKGPARVGLLGLGELKKPSQLDFEKIGAKLMAALLELPSSDVHVGFAGDGLEGSDIAAIANGALLRSYEFNVYRTVDTDNDLPDTLRFDGAAKARKAFEELEKATQGVHWARDFANEPPNILYPASMAKRVEDVLSPLGVKVKVLDEKALAKKGFGAMLAVGKASEHKPRLVVMEYKGPKAKAGKPVALVGKGITFDSGGYSIKGGAAMVHMKYDMSGAAAVAGAIRALAAVQAPVHVVGVLALAENMISEAGYRPDDVLTSLSGKTIEVTNTDAEGRLVLADALTYVQQTYKPRAVADIATLTGACMVALGQSFAGVYANDDAVMANMRAAADATGDRVWPMPLDDTYDKAMDSKIADMKNAATTRFGGSCTAAAFLKRFIEDGTKWSHVDMAPVMMEMTGNVFATQGATGFGVRLLSQWALKA